METLFHATHSRRPRIYINTTDTRKICITLDREAREENREIIKIENQHKRAFGGAHSCMYKMYVAFFVILVIVAFRFFSFKNSRNHLNQKQYYILIHIVGIVRTLNYLFAYERESQNVIRGHSNRICCCCCWQLARWKCAMHDVLIRRTKNVGS